MIEDESDPQARIVALERRLAVQKAEIAYYRRLAKQAGDERLREAEAYSRLVSQLKQQIQIIETQHAELAALHREIERISMTDHLTQVLNRRGIMTRFQQILEARRDQFPKESPRHPCLCALLDIDFFKRINDTHGHGAGDDVLHQLGGILRKAAVLTEADLVGRYGGEEFLFLLSRPEMDAVLTTLMTVVEAIKGYGFTIASHVRLRITVSVGLAEVCDQDLNPLSVIDRADEALYLAKQRGRDQIVLDGRRLDVGSITRSARP